MRGFTRKGIRRQSSADKGRSERYVDRDEFILVFCRDKRLLHLGCIGLTELPDNERVLRFPETLHWRLSQVAQVFGVDNSAAVVAQLRESSMADNIDLGDVQELEMLKSLRSEFDVIVASDIVEHVSNPGRMLDGIHRLYDENTIVLITVPNAFGLLNFLRFVTRSSPDPRPGLPTHRDVPGRGAGNKEFRSVPAFPLSLRSGASLPTSRGAVPHPRTYPREILK